jgi:hypothetical protein
MGAEAGWWRDLDRRYKCIRESSLLQGSIHHRVMVDKVCKHGGGQGKCAPPKLCRPRHDLPQTSKQPVLIRLLQNSSNLTVLRVPAPLHAVMFNIQRGGHGPVCGQTVPFSIHRACCLGGVLGKSGDARGVQRNSSQIARRHREFRKQWKCRIFNSRLAGRQGQQSSHDFERRSEGR